MLTALALPLRLSRRLKSIVIRLSFTIQIWGDEMSVTLADAKRMIEAGEKKAAEIGQPMNIAVADAGGNIVAHVRMDGAWIGSIDISQKKAYTSRAFDITTRIWRSIHSPAISSLESTLPTTARS